MQEVFHAYEKDTELVTELNFDISEVILTVMVNSLRIVWSCLLDMRPEKKVQWSNLVCFGLQMTFRKISNFLQSRK